MAQPPASPTQINIELPGDIEAVYSNFAIINHSPSEIVVDFARLLPGIPRAKVDVRILLTPLNAKLVLKALQANIDKYEEKYGEVRIPSEAGFESPDRTIGFRR